MSVNDCVRRAEVQVAFRMGIATGFIVAVGIAILIKIF